jgi:hypothetical protein
MNELNKKIIDFYLKSNQKKVNDFLPMFYGNPTNSYKVISVGLNPSLTEKFSNELESKKLTVEHFEKANEIEKAAKIENCIEYQSQLKYGINQIPYFKLLKSFFKDIGYNQFEKEVFHYDLYQKRVTDSKIIKHDFEKDKALIDELVNHLRFVINKIEPEIIIILNAYVANLIKDKTDFLKEPKQLDAELGCYFHNGTPVILANQLSGGATSSVYRDILIWKIKRILIKTRKKTNTKYT